MGGEPVEKPARTGDEPEPQVEHRPEEALPVSPAEHPPEQVEPVSPVDSRPEEAEPETLEEARRRPPEPRRMGWRDWALLLVIFLVGMLSARACRGG